MPSLHRFLPRFLTFAATTVALLLVPFAALATDVDGPDCNQQRTDYGDAPEGVQAYPGVAGCFPTCLFAGPAGTQTIACAPNSTPPGATGFVRHVTVATQNAYWLGCAPAGTPPLGIDGEGNGKTNDTGAGFSACATPIGIDCVEAAFGLSFGQDECAGDNDAGLSATPSFSTCAPSSFGFEAYSCATVTRQVVLNVLVDWNQDGDWNDNYQCPGGCAYEWAVKNVVIVLTPGCNLLTTPVFTSGPNNGSGWLRISISDTPVPDDFPWSGSAGIAGQSLQGGETEDYPVRIGDPGDECPPYRDFGDAPEEVQAYPGIAGHFPTCTFASTPGTQELACAPLSTPPGTTGYVMHERLATSPFGFWLGCGDPAGGFPGVDSESDGKMNDTGVAASACATGVVVDCAEAAFGMTFGQDECTGDNVDAGVDAPLSFNTCTSSSFDYKAFNCKPTTVQAYLNILVDWNQDGDWNDNFQCPQACAYEWAVKNVVIGLAPGCNSLTTPSFLSGPNNGRGWLRITITEIPVTDDFPWNGSAPNNYRAGETEDYPITIGGDPCHDSYLDWGDAPEEIPAYAGVIGNFPTCLFPSGPGTQEIECEFPLSTPPGATGYITHTSSPTDPMTFWLGCAVDGEANGKTSTIPPFGPSSACDSAVPIDCSEAAFGFLFGQDECTGGPEAGIALVQTFGRCSTATVPFRATNCEDAPITVHLNVLMDWNRDGDWNDNIHCRRIKACAYEWALKNVAITLLPGCQAYFTPPFQVGPKEGQGWFRISLTTEPVPDDYPWNGSASVGAFRGGETEDYPMQILPSLVDVPERGNGSVELRPLVPNPSRHFTNVTFTLSQAEAVQLSVFDVSGRKVTDLASGTQPAGEHTVRWNFRDAAGKPVPVGIYHVVLQVGDRALVQRAIRLN